MGANLKLIRATYEGSSEENGRNLMAYTRDLYRHPAVRSTVDFNHIKAHYDGSHPWLNPNGIIPVGPDLDFDYEQEALNDAQLTLKHHLPGSRFAP